MLVFLGCGNGENGPQGPFSDPQTVMPTSELPSLRNWAIYRGIVHSHSPYSHDACDNEPFIDGVRNEQCYRECREGMCLTAQDFVFLTDHDDLFAQFGDEFALPVDGYRQSQSLYSSLYLL